MDIIRLMLLAAEEETDSSFDGLFSGAKDVMGVVLIVTGLLLIYFAVKVFKGYRFLPASGEVVVQEDNYVETEAKTVEKMISSIPDFNGGEDREFVEWRIAYTVGDKEYTQVVPDDGYNGGDVLKIKYDPGKPESFYIVDQEQPQEGEEVSDPSENTGHTTGLVLAVLGVLVIIGGAALSLT